MTHAYGDRVVGRKLEDELAARLLLTLVERSHSAHDLDRASTVPTVIVLLLLTHAAFRFVSLSALQRKHDYISTMLNALNCESIKSI